MTLRQALFSPHSVAIVGQSDDAGKTAGRPLKFLRQMGYGGRVYPINPRRTTVLGERAWPALAALPEAPDHVYVVAPTEAAVAAVEECGRLGVKVASVLADGFAEAGPSGVAREARLREVIARTRLRLVGPSSLGVVDLRSKAMLTANAAFDESDLPVGRIFVASHSGSLIGALLSRGKARGPASPGWSRSVTRSICHSAKSARRRSMIPASTAICSSSRPCGTRPPCAASQSRRQRATGRFLPTSSDARPPRVSSRSPTPAHSRARTRSPTNSSRSAALRASIRLTA